jgi:hypothetical protein
MERCTTTRCTDPGESTSFKPHFLSEHRRLVAAEYTLRYEVHLLHSLPYVVAVINIGFSSGSEFPALGGQPPSNPAQAWSRINTQSPSQNRGLPQQQPQHPQQPPSNQQHAQSSQQGQHDGFTAGQKEMFSALDDYRIGGVGVGGGSGQLQGQNQGGQIPTQGGLMDDFPALPRTQGGLGGLDDRELGGIVQRQGMTSRILPHMDSMVGQQGVLSGDADKKVRIWEWERIA